MRSLFFLIIFVFLGGSNCNFCRSITLPLLDTEEMPASLVPMSEESETILPSDMEFKRELEAEVLEGSVQTDNPEQLLTTAIQLQDTDTIQRLLEEGTSPFCTEAVTGKNVFVYAAEEYPLSAAAILAFLTVNVNALDSSGKTLLHKAVEANSLPAVMQLLQAPGIRTDIEAPIGLQSVTPVELALDLQPLLLSPIVRAFFNHPGASFRWRHRAVNGHSLPAWPADDIRLLMSKASDPTHAPNNHSFLISLIEKGLLQELQSVLTEHYDAVELFGSFPADTCNSAFNLAATAALAEPPDRQALEAIFAIPHVDHNESQNALRLPISIPLELSFNSGCKAAVDVLLNHLPEDRAPVLRGDLPLRVLRNYALHGTAVFWDFTTLFAPYIAIEDWRLALRRAVADASQDKVGQIKIFTRPNLLYEPRDADLAFVAINIDYELGGVAILQNLIEMGWLPLNTFTPEGENLAEMAYRKDGESLELRNNFFRDAIWPHLSPQEPLWRSKVDNILQFCERHIHELYEFFSDKELSDIWDWAVEAENVKLLDQLLAIYPQGYGDIPFNLLSFAIEEDCWHVINLLHMSEENSTTVEFELGKVLYNKIVALSDLSQISPILLRLLTSKANLNVTISSPKAYHMRVLDYLERVRGTENGSAELQALLRTYGAVHARDQIPVSPPSTTPKRRLSFSSPSSSSSRPQRPPSR